MSTAMYTLTVGATTYSLADLQISGAALTTAVGAVDVLELTQKTDTIPDGLSALLPNKQYVTLRENGKPIFAGRVMPRTRAMRQGLRRPYRIVGGWSELAGRYYAQHWAAAEGDGVDFSRIGLGINPTTGAMITTGAQIRAAVQYAIDHGAHLALGHVDNGILFVPEYVENQSCAQVVARMLEYSPTMIPFIDYTTTPTPTFHCAEAAIKYTGAALSGGVGILLNATGFGGLSTVTVAREMFVGALDVGRSFDNEINGLVMTVKTQTLQPEEDVEEGQERKYLTSWQQIKEPLSSVVGDEGVIPFSFDAKDFEAFPDLDIPALLLLQARTLLLAVSQIGWTGTGTVKGQIAPLAPGVGYRLNIGNAETAWATMNAVVQTSRRDLMAGTNTVNWGPTRGLTLDQLVAKALGRRKRSPVTSSLLEEQQTGQAPEQNYGFDSKDGDKGDTKDGFVTLEARAWMNVSGEPAARTVQFKGKVVT